jgi:hypothetical protein
LHAARALARDGAGLGARDGQQLLGGRRGVGRERERRPRAGLPQPQPQRLHAQPQRAPQPARGGLSIEETAEVVGSSPATIKREWALARAWLFRRLAA